MLGNSFNQLYKRKKSFLGKNPPNLTQKKEKRSRQRMCPNNGKQVPFYLNGIETEEEPAFVDRKWLIYYFLYQFSAFSTSFFLSNLENSP